MKNKFIVSIFFQIFIIGVVKAQFNTYFNYTDVNTNVFTVPASYMGNNNQNAYNMSILDISQRLSAIYTNGSFGIDYPINSYLKIKKIKFGPDSLRMMILQPIYNPTQKKRCILISPGSGETFSNWYLSNRYAVDFAMRGYIVAYYENAGSTNPNTNGTNKNTSDYFIDKVSNYCNVAPNNTPKDKFLSTMFINLFISNEARKYVVNNSNVLQIDTTALFLAGGSLGANTALFYGYGSNNNWNTNPYYTCVKNKLNYSNVISNNGVRGIMAMGGGLPAPTEALGSIITSADNIPSIWFAGAGDILVNPDSSTTLGPKILGMRGCKNILQSNNINYSMYLNCYGVHSFESPAYDDANIGEWPTTLPQNTINGSITPPYNNILTNTQVTNYVNTNLQNLLYYQYTEFQSYQALVATTSYFNGIINNSIPANAINYIKPTQLQNSPFYKYSIGLYTLNQAALSYYMCHINDPICFFSGAHEYDNIAKNNLNSTFIVSTECGIVQSNFTNQTSIPEKNNISNNRVSNSNDIIFNIKQINEEEVKIKFLSSSNKIEITLSQPLIDYNGYVSFYNLLGVEVEQPIYLDVKDLTSISIDISNQFQHLPKGIYICSINFGSFNKSIKLFKY
ncbi:MAG: hypothetical protein U0T31_07200 [Chitinophagales bacterium]|nr:hypothetical protein [Chitinophagales bacterium]